MPEVVDDLSNEVQSNWKDMAAFGLATGLGSNMLGPLGYGAGAVAAGTYAGGSNGNAMTTIGGGLAIERLITQATSGGSTGGGSRRRM